MTLRQMLDAAGAFAYANPGLILCVMLSLVEVSKIKINPWSWLIRKIGGAVFAGLRQEINNLNDRVASIQTVQARMQAEARENEAKAARNRILRFGDEIYQGVHHSKEYFDHILNDISHYNAYCAEHPEFQNEMTVLTVQHIKKVYAECMDNHAFL